MSDDLLKRLENAIPKLIAFGGHGSWHSQVAEDIAQTSSAIVQQADTIRQQAVKIERLEQETNLLRTMIDEMVRPARKAMEGRE